MILATSAADADAAAPYWSAMLAVVPVLALAMSVEVGRQMRGAEVLPGRFRLIQSVILAGYAGALLVSFKMSLDALANRDGLERAGTVGALVWSSLLALVAVPVWDVLQRVNPETAEVLRRLTPRSPWRKYRKQLRRQVLPEVEATLKIIADSVRGSERIVADVRRARADHQKTRQLWLAMQRFNASVPSEVSEAAGWSSVENLALRGEMSLLSPGTELDKLEWQAHKVEARLEDHYALLRKSERLVRRVKNEIRGARLFRFAPQERTDFRRQIRSVHAELERQQHS